MKNITPSIKKNLIKLAYILIPEKWFFSVWCQDKARRSPLNTQVPSLEESDKWSVLSLGTLGTTPSAYPVTCGIQREADKNIYLIFISIIILYSCVKLKEKYSKSITLVLNY